MIGIYIGAQTITSTILGVPDCKYSIMGLKIGATQEPA